MDKQKKINLLAGCNFNNKSVLKKRIADQSFYIDPQIEKETFMVWRGLLDDRIDMELVNAIFQYQHYSHEYPDIYDAYYLLQISSMLDYGSVIVNKIHIGSTPSPDKQVEKNREKIHKGLSEWTSSRPLDTKYYVNVTPEKGRVATKDGILGWQDVMIIKNKKGEFVDIQLNWLSLEIGSTDSITTYLHIKNGGGVARWAYESKDIWFFINLENDRIKTNKTERIDDLVACKELYGEKY